MAALAYTAGAVGVGRVGGVQAWRNALELAKGR